LAIHDVTHRGLDCVVARKTASAPLPRPSFPGPFRLVQCPTGIRLEVGNGPIWTLDAIHHAVYVSASNVRRYQLPTARYADLSHSPQNLGSIVPVESVRSRSHLFLYITLQRCRGGAKAAPITTGSVNPPPSVPRQVSSVKAKGEKVGQSIECAPGLGPLT